MTRRAPWLAAEFRAAGLDVVTYAGWQDRGDDFAALEAVVWHHDASPPGDSPGVPAYMLEQMSRGKPSAQTWVDRDGTWHVLAAGAVGHAGRVLPGKPGNSRSLGVETDHTTGEQWPPALLDSLRRGTAAILRRLRRDERALEFHKTICDPPGRKVDPDGLYLTAERHRVAALLTPTIPAPAAPAPTPQGARVFIINAKGDPKQYLVQNNGASHITDDRVRAELQAGGVPRVKDADPAFVASLIRGGQQ